MFSPRTNCVFKASSGVVDPFAPCGERLGAGVRRESSRVPRALGQIVSRSVCQKARSAYRCILSAFPRLGRGAPAI